MLLLTFSMFFYKKYCFRRHHDFSRFLKVEFCCILRCPRSIYQLHLPNITIASKNAKKTSKYHIRTCPQRVHERVPKIRLNVSENVHERVHERVRNNQYCTCPKRVREPVQKHEQAFKFLFVIKMQWISGY